MWIQPAGPSAGKRAGTLIGSPIYVDGDVHAGIDRQSADFFRTNIIKSGVFCTSLIGAPEKITKTFGCVMDPQADYKPGFLNGAPQKIGNSFIVSVDNADKMQRPIKSFL